MKKYVIFSAVVLIGTMMTLFAYQANAPSYFVKLLSNIPEESNNPEIHSIGQYVHTVWHDDGLVQYRRNTNYGEDGYWDSIVNLTSQGEVDTSTGSPIHITASGNNVYVAIAYRLSAVYDYEILLRRSTNNGQSWNAWQVLTVNTGESRRPRIACSGSNVYLVWQDDNPGNYEIFFKRSTDSGSSFGSAIRLSYSTGESDFPDICTAGQYVYLLWQDNNIGNFELYFKSSSNYGQSFGTVYRLTYNSGWSWFPRIQCDDNGEHIHVSWSDNNPGNFEIFYKRNSNWGGSGVWSSATRLSYSDGLSWYPDIDFDSSYSPVVCLVWQDSNPGNITYMEPWNENNPGNWEIFRKTSIDNGANWGTAYRITANGVASQLPKASQLRWAILFQEYYSNSNEIYYVH